MLTTTPIPAIAWRDVTARYWGGIHAGRAVAYERRYGPVTLVVYRDGCGRWGCRCELFGATELVAGNRDEALWLAVELLKAEAMRLAEAVGL